MVSLILINIMKNRKSNDFKKVFKHITWHRGVKRKNIMVSLIFINIKWKIAKIMIFSNIKTHKHVIAQAKCHGFLDSH
jgi:hypothetical protein